MAILQGNAKQGSTRGFYPRVINGSLRFNKDDLAKLTWTPDSAGNRKTFTISFWAKLSATTSGTSRWIITANPDTSNYAYAYIDGSSDQFVYREIQGGSEITKVQTNAVYRDQSAWYHFVVKHDSTQATASNRVKLYVNG